MDVFSELVANAAQSIGLPQVYIEKDYWVTRVLKHLSESQYANQAIFKGGTSLSKAYKLIYRFSEDIDLAVMAGALGDGQRKKPLKDVEAAASFGLTQVEDDSRVSKGSSYRKTVYQYPRHIADEVFGQASPELLIEVNAFTTPEPVEVRPIQTLIADALQGQERLDLIGQHGLESFPIHVLSIRRTLVEKLLGVIKDSYHVNPVARLASRIRHLYDICQILKHEEYRDFLNSDEFRAMCTVCVADEKAGIFEHEEHLNAPLGDAPLFTNFQEWTPSLQITYQGVFSQFVYGDVPPMSDIGDTIILIGNRLK
jgi:hypothetical protein